MNAVVKIYGLERTGTNYLEWLLKNNFVGLLVLTNELGWKHGDPEKYFSGLIENGTCYVEKPDVKAHFCGRSFRDPMVVEWTVRLITKSRMFCVIMVKNPYSWYESFAKYARFPLQPIRRQEIRRWTTRNQTWCELHDRNRTRFMVMKYEDLLEDMPSCLLRLQLTFALEARSSWIDCTNRLNPAIHISPERFDRDYFLRRQYLQKYMCSDFEEINHELEPALMKRFDYEYISSP